MRDEIGKCSICRSPVFADGLYYDLADGSVVCDLCCMPCETESVEVAPCETKPDKMNAPKSGRYEADDTVHAIRWRTDGESRYVFSQPICGDEGELEGRKLVVCGGEQVTCPGCLELLKPDAEGQISSRIFRGKHRGEEEVTLCVGKCCICDAPVFEDEAHSKLAGGMIRHDSCKAVEVGRKEPEVIFGYKGGGLPEFAEISERITEAQYQEIERVFNSAWCDFAHISEDEDPLNASETTFDDACGFLIFSESVLTEGEVDEHAAGIVYFLGSCGFDNLRVYYGVSGV